MSKPKRRVKASVRKTVGALFLATSVAVAAIPTGSLQGGQAEAANSCTGVIDREYYIVQKGPGATATDKTPLSEIPYVDPSTTVYTTGDMKFQFAYVNSSGVDVQGDTNKFAVILGYDPSGAVDSAGNLSIPAYVKSYKKLSDAEGYCLANVSGEFLYYRFVDPFDFTIRVKDGDSNPIESGEGLNYFNKDNVGSQSLYDFLLPYVPQEKRNNPGYYSLVKPNKIGLFRVGDPSGEREKDENGLETGYTIFKYTVENTKYYPCTDDNKSKWENVEKSNLFYRDEAEPDTSIDRYKQCDRAEHQYVDDIAVRYIGNQFAYYDVTEKKYKISTDKIDDDDDHPSNGVFADTKGGNIVNLTLPSTMEGIGDYAFYRCTSIKHVDFSNNLVAIGNHSFDGCRTLKSVGMPEDVRMNTIGEYAFKNCSALESFYIPHRIVMLCDGVFENCTSLTNMDLSGDISDDPTTEASQLEKIGNHLFYGCSNLQTLVLPYNLGQGYSSSDTGCRKININIVEDCPNLIRITVVSPNVAFVDDNHAGKCDFLVGDDAHSDKGSFHSQLVSDEFYFESVDPVGAQPPSTNIGALHQMCQNMDTGYEFTYKYYGEELYEKTVTEEGGGKVVYQVDDTNSLVGYLPTGMVKSLTFPEHFGPYHIEKIPDEKCMDTCTLEKVTLPSTINEIGARAFKGCHNLSMVFFGNDKVVIGDEAFKTQHTSLHSTNCPDSLHNADCPDTKGGEPDVKLYFVTSVSADSTPFTYAMSNRGIYNHPQQLDSWPIVFSGFPDLLEISYNPEKKCAELINFPTEGSLNTYASAANKYLNDEEKDAISHYLAERSDPDHPKSREEIKISGTTYDKQLAEVCDELYIPNGVCSIKDGLFWKNTEDLGNNPIAVNTTGLTEFDVVYLKDASGNPTLDADGMVQVDPEKSDFAGCKNLTALTISGDTTLTIPDYAFYDCDGMEYVWSSQSVDDIGKEAFAECSNLQTIEMYGVKSIGDHAFSNDDKLTDVKFDSSVSNLGVAPFRVNAFNRNSSTAIPLHTSKLTDVDFQDNIYFKTENGIIYGLDSGVKNSIIECLPGRGRIIMPSETKGIVGISQEAFADTKIEEVSFDNASFKTLSKYAFEDTENLHKVTLPQTCTLIDDYAFKGSNISTLVVMGDDLDWKSNGLDLMRVTMTDPNVDSTDHGVSEDANKNLSVFAPADLDTGYISKSYERFENHSYFPSPYTPIKHYYIIYKDFVDDNGVLKKKQVGTDEIEEDDLAKIQDFHIDSEELGAFKYYVNDNDSSDIYKVGDSFKVPTEKFDEDNTLTLSAVYEQETYTAVFYNVDPESGSLKIASKKQVLVDSSSGTKMYYISEYDLPNGPKDYESQGYYFSNWESNGINPANEKKFSLNEVNTVGSEIYFRPVYKSSGSGGGVTPDPSTIDYSNDPDVIAGNAFIASYYYPNGIDLVAKMKVAKGATAPNASKPEGYQKGYVWNPDPTSTTMESNQSFYLVATDEVLEKDTYTATYFYTDGVTVYQKLEIEKGANPPDLMMPSGYKQCKWSPDPTSVTMDKNMRFTMVKNPDYTGENDNYTGPYYTLTVINGSGSGSYKPGAQVVISANEAKTGTVFSSWTISPATAPIASKVMSATVVTMPAENVTVTANYVASTANKTNNGAGGNGSGTNNGNNNNNYKPTNNARSSGTTVVIDKNGLSNTGLVSATVNGSTDNFTIKVTASQTADKQIVEALLKKYGTVDNLVYFPMDISLYDAAGTTQIHDTSGLTITITLPLPDSMIQYGANNKVACVVNGELDGLNAKFTTISGVPCVTFTCTHFSPYVIYVNTVEMAAGSDGSGAGGTGTGLDNTPKTADPIHPKWFVSIALFAISLVLFLMKDKKTVKAVANNKSVKK